MRKILVCLILMLAFTTCAFAKEQITVQPKAKKTISEHERRGIAETNLINWEKELMNVAQAVKNQLKFDEDKKRIDDYVASCKNFAKATSDVSFLNYSDVDNPPGESRKFSTGAPAAMLQTEARVYRQATTQLAKTYKSLSAKDYIFEFVQLPEKKTAKKV